MLCPKCGENSRGGRWCIRCGALLELEDLAQTESVRASSDNFYRFSNDDRSDYDDTQKLNTTATSASNDTNKAENTLYRTIHGDGAAKRYDTSPRQVGNSGTIQRMTSQTGRVAEGRNSDNAARRSAPVSKRKSSGVNGGLIAALVVIGILLILCISLLVAGVIGDKQEPVTPEPTEPISDPTDEFDSLEKQALNYIKIGEYGSAEDTLKLMFEIDPNDDETATLYKIVVNYNKSVEALDEFEIEDARDYFDKIPADYMDYEIADDVEDLEDEIEEYESAAETFEDIESYMASGKYKLAEQSITLINEDYLTTKQKKALDEYIDEINANIDNDDNDDDDDEDEDPPTTPPEEPKVDFTQTDASSLISSYCSAYVRSVNNADFSIVSPYLAKDMYSTQKSMVESCVSQGITMSYDYSEVTSLQRVSETKWKVNVSEGETMLYADGTAQSKDFVWTYTVEYIDSKFYLTKIE